MRIIAGQFKGLRLTPFQADHIRPTTDRVKESLFNILGPDLSGLRVLDLFSGTGNLAIEALSRGATEVLAVEKHPQSLSILRKNLAKLKIVQGLQVQSMDVFEFIVHYQGLPFDIILADPPFTQKIGHQVMESLAHNPIWTPQGCVVIETGSKERINENYLRLIRWKQKDFGDKSVHFFRPPS